MRLATKRQDFFLGRLSASSETSSLYIAVKTTKCFPYITNSEYPCSLVFFFFFFFPFCSLLANGFNIASFRFLVVDGWKMGELVIPDFSKGSTTIGHMVHVLFNLMSTT